MVKIRELSHSQLKGQIKKYRDILDKLFMERDKRIAQGATLEELYLEDELEKLQESFEDEQASEQEQSQTPEDFHFELGDSTIAAIQNIADPNSERNKDFEDDEVGITQLINISKKKKKKNKK